MPAETSIQRQWMDLSSGLDFIHVLFFLSSLMGF